MQGVQQRRPAQSLAWLSGALGDTLLGYPALAALRAWAPNSSITAIGRPSYLAFAQKSGLIDAISDSDGPLASGFFTTTAAPSLPRFDLAVVWSAAYRTLAEQLTVLGVHSIIAAPPRSAELRHQARYLLDCLRPLGIPRALRAAPMPPLGSLPPDLQRILGLRDRPVVLLHPGAGARWKRWPFRAFEALAAGLAEAGLAVQWSCGPADADLREKLEGRGVVAWPDLDLQDFAAALADCSLLVSADTGVAHLAALLNLPQLVLFGPTDPRRWRPIGRRVKVLCAPDLCGGDWSPPTDGEASPHHLRRCRPAGADECRCLAALRPEMVLAACLERLDFLRSC